jgi:hypothetical protein
MRLRLLLVTSTLCFWSQPQPAVAETIDCASGDVQCLIAAIHQANANPNKTTIRLAGGTYLLTTADNVAGSDGPNGLPSIVSPVRIEAGASGAIIERMVPTGEPGPALRIFYVGTAGQLTVDGVTIKGGRPGFPFDGGAILNIGGALTLVKAIFDGNRGESGSRGGAVANRQGTVKISDSTFVRNSAGGGGGISNDGGVVTISKTKFERNGSVFGGGLSTVEGGVVSISESRFIENAGEFGGGAVVANPGTETSIVRTTFTSNFSTRNETEGGSAIFVNANATVILRDSALIGTDLFPSNTVIALFNRGTVHVTNTTFAGDSPSPTAPCLGLAVVNAGTMTLLNSTLAPNTSDSTFCIEGVSVLEGRTGSATVLQNTILLHNSEDAQIQDCSGVITSLGNNLIGDPSGCTITLQLTDLVGDANLGTLTDDGSPGNPHLPLLQNSQAIDAANNAACPNKDQIGQTRKPRCDIGAVEFK